MSCWCFCDINHESKPEPIHKKSCSNTIFPCINSDSVDSSIIIYCLICKERVKNIIIYCNYCKVSIGHEACIKTWLIRRCTCPSCNQVLEKH